jgi:UDP-2,4-diacetamido-2,4,6-trideoxy-beta-L-altropyranose hydrolase
MLIVFRADASFEIGSGHVMRCLTLADALKAQGAHCIFISCACPGNLLAHIKCRGYEVRSLDTNFSLGTDFVQSLKPADQCVPNRVSGPSPDWQIDAQQTRAVLENLRADWMVVDHYALDSLWEIELKPHYKKLLVIDDLVNRSHECNVLLDQNLRCDAMARYRLLVPAACNLLLGPAHVMLAPAFDDPLQRIRTGEIKSILVYFGGNDICNQAGQAVDALTHFPHIDSEVILGAAHPYREAVIAASMGYRQIRVVDNCKDMAGAMSRADIGLGTCGMAAWERCALGLPTLVTVSAENQRLDAIALGKIGAVVHLGDAQDIRVDAWINAIGVALADPKRVAYMSEIARTVVAGHSENRRILVNFLMGQHVN